MNLTVEMIFLGVGLYFLLGAGVTFIIGMKQDATQRRTSWIKYLFYLLLVALMLTATVLGTPYIQLTGALIILLGSMEFFRLYNTHKKGSRPVFVVSLLILLILSTGFMAFLFQPANWIIYTYLLVMVCDASSQHSGQLSGRRYIFGELSPHKTLEGILGGVGMTLLTSMLLAPLMEWTLIKSLLVGLSISLFANAGDLMASAFKRSQGAKDFSRLIPGHGGVLDRFDSFLLVGAWAYFLYSMLKVGGGEPPFNRELNNFLVITIAAGAILIGGELIHRLFRVAPEYSRKATHLLVGLLPVLFPWLFDHHLPVLVLNLQLLFILWISRQFNLLKSVDGISRTSYGTFLYPVVSYGLFLLYLQSGNLLAFLLPVIILGICDPLAALVGMGSRSRILTKSGKTFAGSLAFFLSSLVIAVVLLTTLTSLTIPGILLWGLAFGSISAGAEMIGTRGLDNLTIPLSVLLLLSLMQSLL